jgi:Zn-dependent membrane protease YugP
MFGYYYGDYSYFIYILPALIFALYAQARVKRAYAENSRVMTSRGLTGADAASAILRRNGVYDVRIEHIAGQLSDHYDPRGKVIRLSDSVYGSTSVAAVGVAAHEAGHALQYQTGYVPIRLRSLIIPVTQIGSSLAIPLVLIGLFLYSYPLQLAGILFFSLAVIFQLITLPVEFNASRRALSVLEEGRYLNEDELPAAKKVLSAAAMTYIAALAVSLAQFLRLFALVNGRGRNNRW